VKKLYLILVVSLLSGLAAAQFVPHRPRADDALYEKRYQALTVNDILFWMDTTTGDLWRFGRTEMEWIFVGSPRGASTRRKGNYQLKELPENELIILDTDNGEAWWTDGSEWKEIDDPSTRTRRDSDRELWRIDATP
jgi:hypothetical protein